MKLFAIFTLLLFSHSLYAQEPKCNVEITSTDGKVLKKELNLSQMPDREEERQVFWDLSVTNNDFNYSYRFNISFYKNKLDFEFIESPKSKESGQIKNGREIKLIANSQSGEIALGENKGSAFGTDEKSLSYELRKIKKEDKDFSITLDNKASSNEVNVSCSNIILEGKMSFEKPKSAKDNEVIPLDNTSSCSVKVSEKDISVLEVLEKDGSVPNSHSKDFKQIADGIEYTYDAKVTIEDIYYIEFARFFGRRSYDNPGSIIQLTLSGDTDDNLQVEINNSKFSTKNNTKTDQNYRRNKFTVSKVFKSEESNTLYVELIKDSSKILLSCSSPLLEGTINYSDGEITGEAHEDFLKRISNSERSESSKGSDTNPGTITNPSSVIKAN